MLKKELLSTYSLSASLQNIVDIIYPIGSYYWSNNSTDPSNLFGGTWEQVMNKFLYAAGTKSVGTTGGEENHTLIESEMPSHAHTRGTMEITGTIPTDSLGNSTISGAFYASGSSSGASGSSSNNTKTAMEASRSWTGETSYVGGNTSHNNMPPYLVAYCWNRVA